jgi:hypothetical protein
MHKTLLQKNRCNPLWIFFEAKKRGSELSFERHFLGLYQECITLQRKDLTTQIYKGSKDITWLQLLSNSVYAQIQEKNIKAFSNLAHAQIQEKNIKAFSNLAHAPIQETEIKSDNTEIGIILDEKFFVNTEDQKEEVIRAILNRLKNPLYPENFLFNISSPKLQEQALEDMKTVANELRPLYKKIIISPPRTPLEFAEFENNYEALHLIMNTKIKIPDLAKRIDAKIYPIIIKVLAEKNAWYDSVAKDWGLQKACERQMQHKQEREKVRPLVITHQPPVN